MLGIKHVTERELKFNYDKYYKEIALKLKNVKTEKDRNEIKREERKYLNSFLEAVQIDIKSLKANFINLMLDENSSQYLWILYSKQEKEENYIDQVSSILKLENNIIRGGTNTYKMNGWMTHTLYVYQIINENIAKDIPLLNFKGKQENIKQIKELHKIYNKLSKESKFILKVFALIHDIGVIEEIENHDKLGSKYVEPVLKELGCKQETIEKVNISINFSDFISILKELIKYHTLITALSSESSDLYVEKEYRKLIKAMPKTKIIQKEIAEILWILAYGDVIAVDESLMDEEKYQRIKNGYVFFKQLSEGIDLKRNKEKVVIERISDMIGESKVQNLEAIFTHLLEQNQIDKEQFIEDMYHIKLMRFTAPLMKTLNDKNESIKIYYELFELIGALEGKEELKNYTIVFVPDRHENEFVREIKNSNFFQCIKKMKGQKTDDCSYGHINILKGTDTEGKFLHIRVR